MKTQSINRYLHESGLFYNLEKPSRYLGNEYNMIRKKWTKTILKFLLVFPDIYDIGMSHLGLKILYEEINKHEEFLAERAFLPWTDLVEIMEKENFKTFSLENFKTPDEFDVIGFTLQYELSYPGMVKFLQLSHLEPLSKNRREGDPIIIAGGPCVYNPEPIAPFIDVFLIGDAEEAICEIGNLLQQTKGKSKKERLIQMAKTIKGVYVPEFYETIEGEVTPKLPYKEIIPSIIRKRVSPLTIGNAVHKQLIPYTQTVHDRGVIEVMRGCTRGCRFCHAGMVYRPSRERKKEEIIKLADSIIKHTGYDEISLLSLSTLDHSQISDITDALMTLLNKKKISLSIPSSRLDRFGINIAEMISTVRKTGLTVAPEAGTQKMRDRINKNISDEQIFDMIKIAMSKGWKRIKLYFMAGLPFESDSDLKGIIEIVQKCRAMGMKNISVSVSGFIPKPHTPFQFAPQDTVHELHSKIKKLSYLKKISHFEFHKPEISFIEGVLSRGDRLLSEVILKVANEGGYLEAWKDKFSFERWLRAFKEFDIIPEKYISARGFDVNLPWNHIDSGIRRDYLVNEYKKSFFGIQTNDCRHLECSYCGVCFDFEEAKSALKINNQGGNVFDK